MDHTPFLVPLVGLVDSGKGDLSLLADTDFRQAASAPHPPPIPVRMFPSPTCSKKGARPCHRQHIPVGKFLVR